MQQELLDLLVCPKTKAPLELNESTNELICHESQLAYPIRDGIPVMLVAEARPLSTDSNQ